MGLGSSPRHSFLLLFSLKCTLRMNQAIVWRPCSQSTGTLHQAYIYSHSLLSTVQYAPAETQKRMQRHSPSPFGPLLHSTHSTFGACLSKSAICSASAHSIALSTMYF
ncbi:hypothetical protein IE81DRAFT_173993 [Ceraceosorus guamensis]|uniref:Secreted protein n=1 Tax=Ceraceosorus guamensis TaxID=1522189 RepID=A0A316VVM2_9BASI|nr:hypothetical protein IE81DRAFT_173993 [Ceraceosorus guamensis]PWN41492.1 hypothetical protein IE81DRAFT_173993 [Ceraceosorus guamensis]